MVSSTLNSSLLALALFQAAQTSVEAFAPTTGVRATVCTHPLSILMAATEQESKSEDSSFVPLENAPEDDATFAKVEKFGRGSAKVCYVVRSLVRFADCCDSRPNEANGKATPLLLLALW